MRLVDADALVPNEVHTIIRLTATGEQTESVVYAEQIDNAPTIEERKRGQWEWHNENEFYYSCSCCGHKAYGNNLEIVGGTYHFCPNCGAEMRKGEDNERA